MFWFPCTTIGGFNFGRWQVNKEGEIRKTSTHKRVKGRPINGYTQMVYGYTEDNVHKQKTIVQHNLILETFKPRPLEELECDHRNGRRDFNFLKNLRWVTHTLNLLYKPSKGYYAQGSNWEAQLKLDNKTTSLGYFDNEADAKIAYLQAKSKLIQEKSEGLISRLVLDYDYERAAAIEALNWSEADLDFISIFQFCAEQ